MADAFLEERNIVAFPRDVMAAAKIEPLHLRKVFAEFLFDGLKRHREGIGALFAECMEVQALESCELVFLKIAQPHAEP